MNKLSDLCGQSNVTLRELSPSIEQLIAMNAVLPSNAEPQFLELALRVSGSIQSTANWMHKLEEQPFYLRTKSIHAFSREQGQIPAEYVITFTAALGALPVNEVASR